MIFFLSIHLRDWSLNKSPEVIYQDRTTVQKWLLPNSISEQKQSHQNFVSTLHENFHNLWYVTDNFLNDIKHFK